MNNWETCSGIQSARGATVRHKNQRLTSAVSIHAPRAGRDADAPPAHNRQAWFQSTRPARGATYVREPDAGLRAVSIHAPRAGRDTPLVTELVLAKRFNPRAPRGARHPHKMLLFHLSCFNPRAPRGARPPPRRYTHRGTGFNPRAPRGARHVESGGDAEDAPFQSTRPARGATRWRWSTTPRAWRFNPRAPRGARPQSQLSAVAKDGFNPRAPRGARLD